MICDLLQEAGPAAATPDLPAEVLTELRKAPQLAEYREELRTAARFHTVLAALRQRRIAQANARIQHCFIDGIGAKIATIDPEIYCRMESIYGRGCWRDPAFMRDTLQKNPHLRVHCVSQGIHVRVDGFKAVAQPAAPAASKRLEIAYR